MIKSILVAGLVKNDNNIVRFCEDNWLETFHFAASDGAGESSKALPTCDAAIIVTSYISHALQTRTREAYAGKPIFFYHSGMAEIKEELQKAIWGPGNWHNLNNRQVERGDKFMFLLAALAKKGIVKHKRKDFCRRVANMIRESYDECERMFNYCADHGSLKPSGTGRGQYFEFSFNQLETILPAIQKRGFFSLTPGSIFMDGVPSLSKTTVKAPPKMDFIVLNPVDLNEDDGPVDTWDDWEEEMKEDESTTEELEAMAGRILKSIPEDAKTPQSDDALLLVIEEQEKQRELIKEVLMKIKSLESSVINEVRSMNVARSIAGYLSSLPQDELDRMKKVIEALTGKPLESQS